ncbi:PEGA domain-containing protein [Candidatus Daviesbacteria bacterium]|nr:PEGA domain-containing protein [Candidatus Daviesbacteria bacterium]
MSKRFIITISTLAVIGIVAGLAIFLARGYRFSPGEKRIVGTGIINISSEPDAASVFIDGHLTTATNATVASLTPKTYSVRVIKEGFIPWEKSINVKEGLVTEVKITLFPAIPTIYPLTFSGIKNPTLSADSSKLAFIVPRSSAAGDNKKGGIWVWTMIKNQPIAFARSSEPHQIITSLSIDFSNATLRWSSDSKQIMATISNNNYLLNADTTNSDPRDITPILSATLNDWEESTRASDALLIKNIKDISLRKTASDSAFLRWSPDETKFMAREKPISGQEKELIGDVKVYDLEGNIQYVLPEAKSFMWLPNSTHIILVEKDTISLVEFDGKNRSVIYAGNFEDNFVFPWPDSSKLVIVSSSPTPTASEPNLYGINLR